MNADHPAGRLAGITAVWTGSAESAHQLLKALEEAGATIERLPLITLAPPRDLESLSRGLNQLDKYRWLVFTSAEAVRAIANQPPPSARIAAVGPTTARELSSRGWPVDLVPDDHNAAGLAGALISATAAPAEILFLRGDKAKRTLPDQLISAGFSVDELIVYTTVSVSRERLMQISIRIREIADLAIAGSPSGVKALAELHPEHSLSAQFPGLTWICLGPSTQRALENAGVPGALFPGEVTPAQFVKTAVQALKKKL